MLTQSYPNARRLIQIQGVSLLVMAVIAVANGLGGHPSSAVILGLGSLPILVAVGLARRGRAAASTGLTLLTMTALAAVFLWREQGLRDPAILVYPVILVFAALQGGKRLFFGILTFMILATVFLAVANLTGWHVNVVKPVSVRTLIDVVCLLLGLAFIMWVLARDLRRALTGFREENQRALDSQSQVAFLAQHDALTGLPNRILARDRLTQSVAHAQRNHHHAALIHLDLDHFKAINDSLGHQGGDELLRQVAQRITGLLRTTDTVCRQGGDEFLLVLNDLGDSDEAAGIAIKVVEGMTVPFRIQGLDLTLTVSMGIALFPVDGATFDELLQKADTAMYSAKDAGRNTFRFFTSGMNTLVQEHLHLVAGLRLALEREEFVLHYQPQYHLASGRIVGAEALIRWNHPERGLVPPGDFITVAERSGLIGEMGAWALREACRQAMDWRRRGLDLVMSVNISPAQFRRDDLERSLLEALQSSGLPAAALELELTESMLIEDSSNISRRLRNLREMGLSFSIDDFGTGYSNLGYLKRFEVERLKIDQSFIFGLTEDPQNETIVRAMIQMAHGLNLGIVAEGIEDAATLARLTELGCDLGQGFLWAKALPAEIFVAFAEAAAAVER